MRLAQSFRRRGAGSELAYGYGELLAQVVQAEEAQQCLSHKELINSCTIHVAQSASGEARLECRSPRFTSGYLRAARRVREETQGAAGNEIAALSFC